MYQAVTIPSNATSVTLTFWYYITTREPRSAAKDVLNVTIQNSAGKYIATVAILSNLNASTGYIKKIFDLTPYKGRTIRIHFLATTDGSYPTVFRIDDVSVIYVGGVQNPTITSISPSPVVGSNERQWLTINGTNFVSGLSVTLRTNGETYPIPSDRTEFVSSTRVRVYVNVTANPGSWTAQVTNPNGLSSDQFPFNVIAPVPTISSIDPSSRTAGSSGFTLTVNGTEFNLSSVVRWNGSDRPTRRIESSPGIVTKLEANIPASDIATQGTAQVTVFNPSPGGGTSDAVT